MIQRKIKPSSGNQIVDWLFIEIINVVEHVLKKIHFKKVIKDPDDRRIHLYGYLAENHGEVYITHAPKQPATRTLVHESLHVICPYVSERRIWSLEGYLWQRLSDNQKRYLRKYVPRRVTSKEPARH